MHYLPNARLHDIGQPLKLLPLGDRPPNKISPPGGFWRAADHQILYPLCDSREKKSLQCLRICKEYPSEVLLQLDPFLNELTSMFEKSKEKGSVWVTLKRSSLKSKLQKRKLSSAGESIEYRCLIRATDAKKTISTSVGAKDHLRFQASYATILKAHMTALKKRERKDRKKSTEAEKKEGTSTTTKPKKL
ncbi:unnamed protein product [Brassica rapa subsp. trilocularis]